MNLLQGGLTVPLNPPSSPEGSRASLARFQCTSLLRRKQPVWLFFILTPVVNLILPNVPFWSLWKHQKIVGDRPLAMFFKIGVLKNFAIFTGKHLCWKACHFIKKRLQHKCFTVNITKFKNNFFYRTPLVAASERTLLRMYSKNFPNLFNQMFQNSFSGE